MKEMIRAEDVSFTYGNREEPTVKHLSFSVHRGEFVLLTGRSGCGKSTVLKMLNGLIPHESGGRLSGNIWVDGKNTRNFSIADISAAVGLVFQSPEDQIFSATIFDEVAFVLENMGIAAPEIKRRVFETLREVGLSGKEYDSIHALSGGQKQRLAVAAVLAAKPAVLALDEPISQLDPVHAEKLLRLLTELNRTRRITIVLIEHRLHEALRVCGRVMIMEEGKIAWDGGVPEALRQPRVFSGYGLRLPQAVDLCARLDIACPGEDIDRAARLILEKYPRVPAVTARRRNSPAFPKEAAVVVEALAYAYENRPEFILRDFSLELFAGEIVALMGTNGAGKSTLLQLIAGVFAPSAGRILIAGGGTPVGAVGMVMQNPDLMLFNPTVSQEISYAAEQFRRDGAAIRTYGERLAAVLDLNGSAGEFPLALSRGQRLRVAIASIFGFRPPVVLLDEPTTGQDISRIEDILSVVSAYAAEGGAVVFCTHDTEIAARIAQRVIVMTEGRITSDGAPEDIFRDEETLKASGLKQPPIFAIAERLGIAGVTSVEEVVSHVRQSNIGGYGS